MNENYIKMCDCPEIQGQWNNKDGSGQLVAVGCKGDFADIHVYLPKCGLYDYADCHVWKVGDSRITWIPRQEDIQEMLLEATGVPWEWFMLAEAMVFWAVDREYCALRNLNELWLMYYMHEVHNKTWTEKGWA